MNHHIVRIPPKEATVLNSKDRAPFLIQVEVIACDQVFVSDVPQKLLEVPENGTLRSQMVTSPTGRVRREVSPLEIRKFLATVLAKSKSDFGHSRDDPSASVVKEPWARKKTRIQKTSPYGHLRGWNLVSLIVKCGDDLRQEQLASQLLFQFKQIWDDEGSSVWIKPYNVLSTSNTDGFIEPVLNAISLHSLRKQTQMSLYEYFIQEFGPEGSDALSRARDNFVASLAGYSLICYFLQLKDRHNGNILLDDEGHILHIDFGFMLSNTPGGVGIEMAAFKFTKEFLEVMGGLESEVFKAFRNHMIKGFLAIRKHMDKVVLLVEIMQKGSSLACFQGGEETIDRLRERFHMGKTETEINMVVDYLIGGSFSCMSTRFYDQYQWFTNGIV